MGSQSPRSGVEVEKERSDATVQKLKISSRQPRGHADDWRPSRSGGLRCGGDSEASAGFTRQWVPSERKTGVKHAEVITARLVQDERGWLRLAV